MTPMNYLSFLVTALLILIIALFGFFPPFIDWHSNRVLSSDQASIADQAIELHKKLFIGDWHADSTLWSRDLSLRHSRGHLDIPRMQDGNVALQMFTSVTQAASNSSYTYNVENARDEITLLAIAQHWPLATWTNLTERAAHQAKKLRDIARFNQSNFMLITSQTDLAEFLDKRQLNSKLVGGLLGIEGSHALEGQISNIKYLFGLGFRMMSLQHFFDNQLGGSLHGESRSGLTFFGRKALFEMQRLNIIVDLSHSSEKVVRDVLEVSKKPVVLSHTGFLGHCPSARNISEQLMREITSNGGLIAVGFWEGAICGNTPRAVADAISYGVKLLGDDAVSLGSDFDGNITTTFDASELILLTQNLLDLGLSEKQIKKVMGENMLQFLQNHLPPS